MVCWMTDEPLRPGAKLPSSTPPGRPGPWSGTLRYRLDINTLHRDEERRPSSASTTIGRVRLRTTQPLFLDHYRRNRTTGGFILVDETTNATVGAGTVLSTM